MIVSPEEYSGLLSRLIDPNEYTDLLRIPTDETLHEINLDERKINAPEFLSVTEDHNSEIMIISIFTILLVGFNMLTPLTKNIFIMLQF